MHQPHLGGVESHAFEEEGVQCVGGVARRAVRLATPPAPGRALVGPILLPWAGGWPQRSAGKAEDPLFRRAR